MQACPRTPFEANPIPHTDRTRHCPSADGDDGAYTFMTSYAWQRGLERPVPLATVQITLAYPGILDLDKAFVRLELTGIWHGVCREDRQGLAKGMYLGCALGGRECRHEGQFDYGH